jgi:hypothetical protein
MSKLTPIERHIAGQPIDRRRRWDQRMADAGFRRVNLWVPAEYVELLKELKDRLLAGDPEEFEALHDFLTMSYRSMLEDPSCDDDDRAYAEHRLRHLAPRAPSGARAHGADCCPDC